MVTLKDEDDYTRKYERQYIKDISLFAAAVSKIEALYSASSQKGIIGNREEISSFHTSPEEASAEPALEHFSKYPGILLWKRLLPRVEC